MGFVALLGAGFSRNWGGWLASEAFEYLLICPQIDEAIRELLWKCRRKGGFEAALARLQEEYARQRNSHAENRLKKLQDAILQMFADMDGEFATTTNFEPQNVQNYTVSHFLNRFDAIFTLNQDLLLERQYLDRHVHGSSHHRWSGCQVPGMRRKPNAGVPDSGLAQWVPADPSKFAICDNAQPYFKLHGSTNWIDDSSGRPMLVMGAAKDATIQRHAILKWYMSRFEEYLSRSGTRLMVIGYSFGDDHINQVIGGAADRGTLQVFIVDPLGIDVLDKHRNAPVYSPDPLFAPLQPHLIGASRRTMREISGADRVEHRKVMKFFTPV